MSGWYHPAMAAPPEAPCEAVATRLVETHAHLTDPRFAGDLDTVLQRAEQAGVVAIVVVGYDVASSAGAVALAERHPQIWAAVGLHPHNARSFDQQALTRLERLLDSPRTVAVGECGLDYYRNLSTPDQQRRAFAAQLDLAAARRLPVIVHSREAMAETLATLAGHDLPRGGVLHCFDGDVRAAQRAVDLGLHVSAAGPLTYRRDQTLARALAAVPAERLVVETDCPYLSPAGHRGERNEPAHVRLVAGALAQLRGATLAALAAQTTRNAESLFRLPLAAIAYREDAA
jgi:TatD DNase family protein